MANTLRRTDKTHTHIGQQKVEIGRERARVRGRGEWQNKNNIPKCICIKMCVQYVFLRVTVPVTGRVLCGAGRDFFLLLLLEFVVVVGWVGETGRGSSFRAKNINKKV